MTRLWTLRIYLRLRIYIKVADISGYGFGNLPPWTPLIHANYNFFASTTTFLLLQLNRYYLSAMTHESEPASCNSASCTLLQPYWHFNRTVDRSQVFLYFISKVLIGYPYRPLLKNLTVFNLGSKSLYRINVLFKDLAFLCEILSFFSFATLVLGYDDLMDYCRKYIDFRKVKWWP
jgi:hypothetical protein